MKNSKRGKKEERTALCQGIMSNMDSKIKTKAQVSLEYLMLVGVAMALIVPSIYLFSERQKSMQSEMFSAQVNEIGNTIIDNVNTVNTLGIGSELSSEFNLPKGIVNLTVLSGRELVFKVVTNLGEADLVYTCQFCNPTRPSLNGTFSVNDTQPGKKRFRVKSCNKFIVVERVFKNSTGEYESTNKAVDYGC